MKESEVKNLIQRILNVSKDKKSSRVAASIFINRAEKKDAMVFMEYLDHNDLLVKKVARQILGNMGIREALEPLINEFYQSVGALTFLPDAEYKEAVYYSNLIEILEAVFLIIKSQNIKNENLLNQVTEIFKKTKNEDLRFSLIKLIGILGDSYDFLTQYYDQYSEKEKRALYYIFSFVENPKRLELFEKGLLDEPNFEFVVSHLLKFDEGRRFLAGRILSMSSSEKKAILQKLNEGVFPEFEIPLVEMLNDENRYIVDLAADIYIKTAQSEFPQEKFIGFLDSGYSPDLVRAALKIVDHFSKDKTEEIFLNALDKQALYNNKIIILEFIFQKLKTKIELSDDFCGKIIEKLIGYFNNYSEDKDEFLVSVIKIVSALPYDKSLNAKNVKHKLLSFGRTYQTQLSKTFKNNLNEGIVKFKHIIERLEASERKVKDILILFDIDPAKIEAERIEKLREQLNDIGHIDPDSTQRLLNYLIRIYDISEQDWKKRSVALDLLGDYGTPDHVSKLKEIAGSEKSLGVKVSAQKALEKIGEKYDIAQDRVLIIEPLFYLNKILNDFFTELSYKIVNIKQWEEFDRISDKSYSLIFVSDMVISQTGWEKLRTYQQDRDLHIIIITANTEKFSQYQNNETVTLLTKPFNKEKLQVLMAEIMV